MSQTEAPFPRHIELLVGNAAEVDRLNEIHVRVAGSGPGYKAGVEVLNKSAIVLLVACWEAFVEDLASRAFEELLRQAKKPNIFPRKVLALASKDLREHRDESRVWSIAGTGWKIVLKRHRDRVIDKFVGPFHTPDADNIDRLFESLVGIRKCSNKWSWKGMSANAATKKLDRLITLRGEIAHRVETSRSVHKKTVTQYTHFIKRLAGVVSNIVSDHLTKCTNIEPWTFVTYAGDKKLSNREHN